MRKHIPPSVRPGKAMGMAAFQVIMALSCTSLTYAATVPGNSAVMRPANVVERTITGRVVDETNSGLPGVSIVIKGTTRGTVKDTAWMYPMPEQPLSSRL